MRIVDPETDQEGNLRPMDSVEVHLVKLLDGLSKLDERDQERVINMVDTLDAADKKLKDTLFTDNPPSEN